MTSLVWAFPFSLSPARFGVFPRSILDEIACKQIIHYFRSIEDYLIKYGTYSVTCFLLLYAFIISHSTPLGVTLPLSLYLQYQYTTRCDGASFFISQVKLSKNSTYLVWGCGFLYIVFCNCLRRAFVFFGARAAATEDSISTMNTLNKCWKTTMALFFCGLHFIRTTEYYIFTIFMFAIFFSAVVVLLFFIFLLFFWIL